MKRGRSIRLSYETSAVILGSELELGWIRTIDLPLLTS
jgi:hypothetical protein